MIDYEGLIRMDSLKTPAYIFNIDCLDQHLNNVRAIVGFDVKLCYAMKANPFLAAHIAERLDYVEVCSRGELDICMSFHISGEKILFSGINKSRDDIKTALEYGIFAITVESLKHYMLISECCNELSCQANVYLRLSNNFQFGMHTDVLEDIIKNRTNYPRIHITGIHYFTGTQVNNLSKNLDELRFLNDYLAYLFKEYDFCVKVLEYGTGLSVPYFTNQNIDDLYEGLRRLTDEVKLARMPWETVFEMGRFFVAETADYATKIVDIKYTENKNYCVVDGGIHHLNYYGQNMAMRTPFFSKISVPDENEKKYYVNVKDGQWTVCGSLCTFADVLMKNITMASVDIGDVFIFKNAGAYSIAEAPVLLLNRDLPYVYAYKKNEGLQLIKESEKVSGWYCNISPREDGILK